MKKFNYFVAFVALLAVMVFTTCEKMEQFEITPSAESTKIGVNSIYVSKMTEHSLIFDIKINEMEKYKAYFENENGSLKFGIGNINAFFEDGILTLKEDGGCPQGQDVDIDCVCAATDYLCVCCGDCG
jgi:hypothetical protein